MNVAAVLGIDLKMTEVGKKIKPVLPRLQFITLDLPSLGHVAQAEQACQGGVRWVQLRAKGLAPLAWIELARAVQKICRAHHATFIINDSVEVAAQVGADGVHLGASDASPLLARQRLGAHALIGVTLNYPRDLDRLTLGAPNYVGLGPFRATDSKPGHAPVHTPTALKELVQQVPLPTFVIGGVTQADFSAIQTLGAHGVALSAAIARAASPQQAAAQLCAAAAKTWI
jgi:thiamine-phosphate pyrophosphorylase